MTTFKASLQSKTRKMTKTQKVRLVKPFNLSGIPKAKRWLISTVTLSWTTQTFVLTAVAEWKSCTTLWLVSHRKKASWAQLTLT